EARDRFLEGRGFGHVVLVAVLFGVMLGVGTLAEHGFQRAVRGIRRSLDGGPGVGLAAQATHLVVRLALGLLALVAFAAAALAFFFALYQGHEPTRHAVLTYLAAVLIVRLAALVSRLLLAPAAPAQRLLPFSDETAQRLHRAVVALAAFYAFGTGTIGLLRHLGAPAATLEVLSLALATARPSAMTRRWWSGAAMAPGTSSGPPGRLSGPAGSSSPRTATPPSASTRSPA